MTDDVMKVIDEAMKLSVEARAAIAGSLIESLDETVDENAEAAWADAIAKRLAMADAGKAKFVPWSDVKKSILGAASVDR